MSWLQMLLLFGVLLGVSMFNCGNVGENGTADKDTADNDGWESVINPINIS